VFFFSSRRRHTRSKRDWSSDVCSSDLVRFVRIAVEKFSVDQVRFTGGEPLTRKDINEIIAGVAALEPRPNIALTTNAIGLDKRRSEERRVGKEWGTERSGCVGEGQDDG